MAEKVENSPRPDEQTSESSVSTSERQGPAKRGRLARDLTTGSIPKNLWFLAWPQLVESVLNISDQLADALWAGRIGAHALAGLGVAQSYLGLTMTGRMGLDTAMRAMIARSIGKRDIAMANHVALQAFTLSTVYCSFMAILGIFFTEQLLRFIGVSEGAVGEGSGYMRIMLLGQATFAFRMMGGAALQAAGDAITPMKATTATRVGHILLSPCLVFGWLIFPQMGLAGAAMAQIIANTLGIAIIFHALFTGKSMLHLSLRSYRLDFPLMWQIIKVGAPASLTSAERTLAQLMLIGIVAPFGDFAVAAFSLTRRTEMLSHFASMGVGQASGILAGQCLGANKPNRARKTVAWAVGGAAVFHLVLASILLAFPEFLVSLFNNEPELLGPAVIWLRLQAISFIFLGPSQVLLQSFNVAGDTFFPMIVTLATIWAVQQPLALFLPGVWGLGQFGVGWAVNVSSMARMAACGLYFLRGTWLTKNPFAASQGGEPAPRIAH